MTSRAPGGPFGSQGSNFGSFAFCARDPKRNYNLESPKYRSGRKYITKQRFRYRFSKLAARLPSRERGGIWSFSRFSIYYSWDEAKMTYPTGKVPFVIRKVTVRSVETPIQTTVEMFWCHKKWTFNWAVLLICIWKLRPKIKSN